MSPRSKRSYPAAIREQALARAEETTAARASRELGIPVATIYGWRQEDGKAGPPARIAHDPEARALWASRKEEGADESWQEAKAALALVKQRLAEGAETKAKTAALTFAILADKSAMLEQSSALEEERRAKLAEAQVELIATCLSNVVKDLELPATDAFRELFRHHLVPLDEGQSEGRIVGPAPTAARAREELREKFREVVEVEPADDGPPLPDLEARVVEGPSTAEILEGLAPEWDEKDETPDGVCPSCREPIPPEDREIHHAGLDQKRLYCPRQDLDSIKEQQDSGSDPLRW